MKIISEMLWCFTILFYLCRNKNIIMEKLHATYVDCDTYFYILKNDGKFEVWRENDYLEALYTIKDSEQEVLNVIKNIILKQKNYEQ